MGCCCGKKGLSQEELDRSTTVEPEDTVNALQQQSATKSKRRKTSDKTKNKDAVKIQAVWRQYSCRHFFLKLRHAAILIQSLIRELLSRKSASVLLKDNVLHNLLISLDCVTDVEGGGSHNLYVVITGYNHARTRHHYYHQTTIPATKNSDDEQTSGLIETPGLLIGPESRRMKLVSYGKSQIKVGKGKKLFYWGEHILLTGLHFDSDIVLTLFEHHRIHTDTIIGQNIINLLDMQPLYRGVKIPFHLPSATPRVPVKDASGHVHACIPRLETTSESSLTFGVSLAPITYSMCGHMLKLSFKKFGRRDAWEKRWFVLMDGRLSYYENKLNLEAPRGTIYGRAVVTVAATTLEKELGIAEGKNYGPAIKIVFGPQKTDCWYIKLMQNDSRKTQLMWIRKLKRFALHVASEELEEAKKVGLKRMKVRIGELKDTHIPREAASNYHIHEKPTEE